MRPRKINQIPHCDCGNVATKRKHGENVCDRCDEMEHNRLYAERQRARELRERTLLWTGEAVEVGTLDAQRV